ncbi:molybdopterin synthase, large subunit [Thiomonas sp. X19]|uniref:molybdenum cofactor biosynthesis protein MoaE n=1 Tax=Thiomonas sp. X19 TaxID=1050370 RepID=UPI000B649E91|nr:molybdenum cofactor biosynthesis protein MoaE [Thiomonas sp. X19]SCC94820.1 molybdopterin synthase, large subunit [Thiomonas sp. X19]
MLPFEPTIRIQHKAFDAGKELHNLRARRTDIGAVASFEGICRDHNTATLQQGKHSVEAMELEHYPGMTEQSILRLVVEAQQRWPLQAATVIHRIGVLQPGDLIVFVAVASAHRHAAFEACAFLMDHIKTQAPFWKKETTSQGMQWVDAHEADVAAMDRWSIQAASKRLLPELDIASKQNQK